MLSGSITNTLGDSLIYRSLHTPMDYINSAAAGSFGGFFGYRVSSLGGNIYQNAIFENMSRSAQRNFMRSTFNIRSNISGTMRGYLQNNTIAN